ncbi:hypothetical protein ASZ90_019697 [hydrocarbon metagenome]|uniref:Metallo-beta-lactamase domain-containing protein n=1 Tax=hydrocarbon metagenome TaxID=938273 RepID=A0A0W8E358_9ZZZZ
MAVMTIRIEGRAMFSMKDSLEKLSLLDVAVVYPGHGKPFTNFDEAIDRAKKRIQWFLDNRERIGEDLLKKLIIYTVMRKRKVKDDAYYQYLMGTYWFKETIDLYFNGEYEEKYKDIISGFINRGILKLESGFLYATIKP